MRIASLSKPITSIAVMKLIEENKLTLDTPVFGETGILGTDYGMPVFNGQPAEITVRNLLEHTAGGWGNSIDDPMFAIRNRSGKELIREVLICYLLENIPGQNYDYSNFGYYVLGKVIETVTGASYEDYVKTNILIPCGIDGMRIGSDVSAIDEAEYIRTADDESPYLYSPRHLEAGGGWIANPVELLKILTRVNPFNGAGNILSGETISVMTSPSFVNENYALGWETDAHGVFRHNGSLPGTSAEMGMNARGFSWVILINSRVWDSMKESFETELRLLFSKIEEAIEIRPEGIEL